MAETPKGRSRREQQGTARRSNGMSHPASSRFVRPALVVGVSLLLGAVSWFCFTGEELPFQASIFEAPRDSTGAGAANGEDSARDSVQEQLGCLGAPVGSTFRYRVTDRSDFEVHSAEAGSQPAGNLHVECVVTTTVLDRRAGEVLVQQRIEDLKFLGVDGRAITNDPVQESFVAATAASVLVRMNEHGKLLGFGFMDGLDGDQRNFLRGTLAVLAFQAPEEQVATWTCDEADTTGEYEARYEVIDAAAGEVAVRRTKLHYQTIAAQAELPKHALRGAGTAWFATKLGWLGGAKLDEGMTMALPLLDLQASTARRAEAVLVAADRVEVGVDVASEWSRANAPASGRLEQVGRFAAMSERRRWEQQLQGVTLDQLLAELVGLLAQEPADAEAVNGVFQKLKWLVKLDERVAVAIGERVATRQLSGELAGVALSSLGAAGTPAAQAVLTAVRADRSLEVGVRQAATIATLQLAEPSAQLVDGLAKDAAEDFDGRAGAMLVLGALSGRASQPLADGRSPVAALLAMESDATARGELSTWVLAVGNANPPQALPIAQRCLGNTDPAVRASACVALRRVADAAVVTVLVERGLADTSPIVRREAMLVLARRSEPAARAALAQVAQNDPDEELRKRAGELLRAGA